jgi:LPS-assembly lipoprotein
MWWFEHRSTVSRIAGLATTLALASLLTGCFEPLYGAKTLTGSPALQQRFATIGILPIPASNGTPLARIAVELQNDLAFDFTGGGGQTGKTHELRIIVSQQTQQVIVDVTTARPDMQQFGLSATYTLTEVATGKVAVTGSAFARVSYDTPGQQQRFASARGQRDAETRAAKVISDNIKGRLASYFTAGT